MRIALRTSGGRGEYEIAGRQGHVRNSDLFDHAIAFQVTPELVVPGRCVLLHYQGKPRIRLAKGRDGVHSYRLLSAILLLPKPIREFRKTGEGSEVLRAERYSVLGVDVDVANVTADQVTLRPRTLYLANFGGAAVQMSFSDRMARVMKLWELAESNEGDRIADCILNHREMVLSVPHAHKAIEKAASLLRTTLGDGDILDDSFLHFGENAMARGEDEATALDLRCLPEGWDSAEEEPFDSFESTCEELRKWRRVAARGASGRRFSVTVKKIYDHTCLFTGLRLPSIVSGGTTGVEAAHILPWSPYRINAIPNGLCLNRLCHWAFDTGLLSLTWEGGEYMLLVPDLIKTRATQNSIDIAYFRSLEGEVPLSRLPKSKRFWPSPRYLQRLRGLQGL